MQDTHSIVQSFERKGYRYIANGAYGRVYGKDGEQWIVKRAENDGTRTFLEWCLWRTKQGRRMRGMPHLDFLIEDHIGYMYLVGMRRYESARELDQRPSYITELITAFEEETKVRANDLHQGNIMYDKKTKSLIVTDPSSRAYTPLGMIPNGLRSGGGLEPTTIDTMTQYEHQ